MEEKIGKKVKTYEEVEKEYRKKELEEVKKTKKPQTTFRSHSVVISTTISSKFWELAKEHNIPWSEALRIGLSIVFAEKGVMPYDNKLNLYRKMNYFRQEAEKSTQKVNELTDEIARREGVSFEKKEEDGNIQKK